MGAHHSGAWTFQRCAALVPSPSLYLCPQAVDLNACDAAAMIVVMQSLDDVVTAAACVDLHRTAVHLPVAAPKLPLSIHT